MTNEKVNSIEQIKKYPGSITLLDATHVDIVTAHHLLGQDARAQIYKILTKQMDDLGSAEKVAGQLRRARHYAAAVNTKAQSPSLVDVFKTAINKYMACLCAWADGAGLAEFHHTSLAEIIDGLPVTAQDLAFCLQEDGVGCQTGVYRERDGSVILWHSEENVEDHPDERFDKLRLFSFRTLDGHIATGFIYPDLLPGPTFGWRNDHFVQAVDTLHIRWQDHETLLLPNTLAWLSLYLGMQFSREELVRVFGPFQGGYSMTAIAKDGILVAAEKVEFANGQQTAAQLSGEPGSFLFQTNAINDLSLPIGGEEEISPVSRINNLKRVARTSRFIKVIRNAGDALPLIFRMLCSRAGGDFSYSNQDVKAYLVCRMSAEKTTIQVGSGSATPSDELFSVEIK
jgi:hypothetical protein